MAVLDLGASAIRLVVAEVQTGQPARILEEVSRGVLLGKDTFTSGRLGPATIEATLKALEGFRREPPRAPGGRPRSGRRPPGR